MKIKDKEFDLFIPRDRIDSRIIEIGWKINKEYADKNPVFIIVLNGAFMFASDLMKVVTIASELTFIKLSSYEGTESSEKVKEIIGLSSSITNRHVLIIEDIVDTGITMEHIINTLTPHGPASIDIATFLFKPKALKINVNLKYVGFEIPPAFVVGYGLDYDGYGRNLGDVFVLSDPSNDLNTFN